MYIKEFNIGELYQSRLDPFGNEYLLPKLKDSSQFLKEILTKMEKFSPTKLAKSYDDRTEIHLLLPSIDKKSVTIELVKNELTISYKNKSEFKAPFAPKDFSETFFIDGEKYDLDKISTTFEQGVLSITIPAIEKVEPKFEKKSIKIS